VERAVARTGHADFWTLRERRAIPRETTNYVPIILALTIMHKNAKDYGLENIEIDPPLTYDTLELSSATHLALVADAADRPVSDLKELNPSLLTNVAPAGHLLRVPEGTKTMVLAGLDTIPPERRASWRIHRVAEGDTMESIARRYHVPVNTIAAANAASDSEVGDVLVIPTATQIERARGVQTRSRRAESSSGGNAKAGATSATKNASKPARRKLASGTGVRGSSFR